MHRNEFHLSKKDSKPSLPDLRGHHKRKNLITKQEASEAEMNKIIDKIEVETTKPFITASEQTPSIQVEEFIRHFEERKKQGLEDLSYLRDKSDEIIAATRELAKVQTPSPEQILKYLYSQPSSKKMDNLQEEVFLAMEEALGNTFLIPAMPSQLIEYQLGILGEIFQNEEKYFSLELFHNLTLLRVDQAPDFLKFIKINGTFYKSSPLEICQLADKNLQKKECYQHSKDNFIRRFHGIKTEILQHRLKKFKESEDLCLASVSSDNTIKNINNETITHLSTLEVLSTPLESSKTETISAIKKNIFYYLTEEASIIMQLMLPEHKKNSVMLDEVIGSNLWAIMQASLSVIAKISEEKKFRRDLKFIADLERIANEASHKCKENMRESYPYNNTYLVNGIKAKLKRSLEQHKNEETENKDNKLKGEALINAYFEKINHFFSVKLMKKRHEIKEQGKANSFFGTISKSKIESGLKIEQSNLKIYQEAMANLKKFALVHQNDSILIYTRNFGTSCLKEEKAMPTSTNSIM